MRKLSLTVIGCYLSILAAFSQNTPDSSAYKKKKLSVEELNFVSGYYNQNGNHSAVTGGTGTEKLTDFANTIELKLFKYDRRLRKHTVSIEIGVDHYTSASSDKIDPSTISSPSYADTRFYPSVGWTMENETKGTTIGLNASLSKEYDYTSFGIGASYSKTSKDKNREFSAKAQAYFDNWTVILPIELRPRGSDEEGTSPRNSFSASLSYSQVISQNLQLAFVVEPTYQNGLLATRYQRVYFNTGKIAAETLPDNRKKLPLGLRANYFFGDRLILRSFYRYYMDDWGVKAHTIDLEAPLKITPSFSISPFYRYYVQTAADYFSPYGSHQAAELFFTSDYDLSTFHSQFFGAGIRLVPTNGIFGFQHINSLELRAGHYIRSEGLSANNLSLHVNFK
ncbi:MAG: DUF3570 domain-containing protein [Chitinophagaceae bacterium]|nr:MAG: DUF3570 domain-containing protein [Chitinophagaceae bacterium]